MATLIKTFFEDSEKPYCVIADRPDDSSHVDFEVYEGREDDSRSDLLFKGYIKWDGCSNWHFSEGNYILHLCEKNLAKNFGELWVNFYEMAQELMPENKEYLI